MKTLETQRLILRAWNLEDAADVFAYASGGKVGPMAGWKPHENPEETKEIIKRFLAEEETWAVEWKETHTVIGSVGLHKRAREGVVFDREIGYVLSEAYWGHGIMPEAVSAVLRFAFEELGLQTLLVTHFSFNKQSERVIRKTGFRYLKHLSQSYRRYDGTLMDEDLYLLDRADYPFELGRWMEQYIGKMQEIFPGRIDFIGLQGSMARGEARQSSDIDVVLILDRIDPADLSAYKNGIRTLPWHGKACGFLSDKETLRCWDRSDLFQFYYDTKPYFGSLQFLRPLIRRCDVRRAVHLGACNIRHLCGHNFVYGDSQELLAGLYKSAVFVLQAKHFCETGAYLSQRSGLREHLSAPDAEILRIADALREGCNLSEEQFQRFTAVLYDWSGRLIRMYAEADSRS